MCRSRISILVSLGEGDEKKETPENATLRPAEKRNAGNSRVIFAVEFDWRGTSVVGKARRLESIAPRVILNLRLQFSLRPARIPREDPGFPLSLPRCA